MTRFRKAVSSSVESGSALTDRLPDAGNTPNQQHERQTTMTNPNNTAWSEAEVLEGLDMLDKAELEGKPFLIVGVEFKPNNAGVSIAYIDGEYRDGTGFTF